MGVAGAQTYVSNGPVHVFRVCPDCLPAMFQLALLFQQHIGPSRASALDDGICVKLAEACASKLRRHG